MDLFGRRMKQLRNKQNITLEELAKELNSTKATLSRYENGKRVPDIEFAHTVADFFNVSVDYLLGRKEKEQPQISNEYVTVVGNAKAKEISPERLQQFIDFMFQNDKINKENDKKRSSTIKL